MATEKKQALILQLISQHRHKVVHTTTTTRDRGDYRKKVIISRKGKAHRPSLHSLTLKMIIAFLSLKGHIAHDRSEVKDYCDG